MDRGGSCMGIGRGIRIVIGKGIGIGIGGGWKSLIIVSLGSYVAHT